MPSPSQVPAANVVIVAIGASAGGLEATSRLLDAVPATSGMAFIVVQHLDPTHKSLLVELLAEHTAMEVVAANEGCPIVADTVYVIPPGSYLSVRAGALHLSPPDARHGARLPFDYLLKSLAQSCGAQTIAVFLSGTGADGSAGLPALKQAGGHAIAQAPDEAEYTGMPRSAIDSGLVDRVLALADMPAALCDMAASKIPPADAATPAGSGDHGADLVAILSFLRDKTGHDFLPYKPGTMARRIARRMALLALPPADLVGYLERLRDEPAECDRLASDLLINVTNFFRDPKVFETLEATILPETIRQLPSGQALRIWVAGCSTGEEAYSMAMICQDALSEARRDIKLQIFASDIDPDAIAIAREGFYQPDITAHVPAERLARHFIAEEGGYRVAPALRGQVVFSVQNVLTDPPFSRIDLITCRNLLIYLNTQAQAKVLTLFHFALKEGGTLVLGTSETVGKAEDRFAPIIGAEGCYRHIAHSRQGEAGFPFSFTDKLPVLARDDRPAPSTRQANLADLCNRAVLAHYAPAAVLINRQHECLFSIGPTNRFLRVAPGYATLDLLAMASPALRTRLRLAINRAIKGELRVDGGRTRLTADGATIWFRITVECLAETSENLMLVCFIEEPAPDPQASTDHTPTDGARIAELERELAETQADLQASIQQREIINQEHKSINEEALSVNEEFQSANEELLTSKEELQSLNEELTALNSQLQETLDRQRLASDDLQNVLYSTNVGTMFLDTDLKIRFFTPAIKPLFNVIPGDLGRPLADLRPVADDPDLLIDAQLVLTDGATIEREVAAPDNVWFMRRIFPYRAHDSRVQGVVITFADITERKQSIAAFEAAKHEAERANVAKSRFLAAASHDLRQPLQVLTLLKDQLAHALNEGDPARRAGDLFARFDQTLRGLSGMLDVLLNINQIEVGAVNPHRKVFCVTGMLDRLRDEFMPLAEARGLSLTVLPSAARVESDPLLLEQIIRNLLGNAVKYTRQGRIVIACRHRGGNLRIEVRDSGIGIEEDQLQAIFEEFHQVDNPARNRNQGLGLGLAIVQRLGDLLGHTIDVRSVPGKGSVFAVTVPCRTDDAPPSPEAEPQTGPDAENTALPSDTAPSARHRSAIVVVEDDPDLLDLLAQLLRSRGHSVSCAPDAAVAMELIAKGAIRPDILLTDYNLPGGKTGIELLAGLRAMLRKDLPAIVLTGDISTDAVAQIANEACIHLSKPVEPEALMRAIGQLCSGAVIASASGVAAAGTVGTGTLGPGDRAAVTYIIDDEAQIRLPIRDLLLNDGQAVMDFASAEAFLAAYRPGTAGCLLIDAHLPGLSGIGLLGKLRARGDHVPVIMITGDGDVGLAVEAMRAGASEFIEKPVGSADLLASIHRATAQSRDIRLVDEAHADAAQRAGALTARQKEVMTMVLAGHPSKNIAADLGISQRTVENHRAEIMQRMGAKSIPELARKVLISGG